MNETRVKVALMSALKVALTKCVIFKHCDRFTAGIPDMSIAWSGSTSWVELKFLRGNKTVHDELGPDQLITCARLEVATARCWIVAYEERSRRILVYRPTKLMGDNLPATELAGSFGLAQRAWEQGAIHFENFEHRLVADLIRQTHV